MAAIGLDPKSIQISEASLGWTFFTWSVDSLPNIKLKIEILVNVNVGLESFRSPWASPYWSSLNHVNLATWRILAVSCWDWLNRVCFLEVSARLSGAKQRFLLIKERFRWEENLRSVYCCHLYFLKVSACKKNLITTRTRKKRTIFVGYDVIWLQMTSFDLPSWIRHLKISQFS